MLSFTLTIEKGRSLFLSKKRSPAGESGRQKAPTALELTRENLVRNIIKLAVPAVLENLLWTMVFLADTILVGWLKDANALAAVSLGGMFIFILNSLFMAIAVSATALVARSWGAKEYERAKATAGQAYMLALLMAAVFVVLIYPLADDLFVLMGVEPEVVALGSVYVRLILTTSFLGFPLMVANGIMRGAGDTRTPMLVTLAMNGWNVVAAYVLIFGVGPFPAWGVKGAGAATASARLLGGGLALGILLTGRTYLRVELKRILLWDKELVGRIVRLSLPTTAEMVVMRTGSALFMRIISALGSVALAAHQVTVSIESLSFMPAFGLTAAATTLVGQSLGANDPDLAEASIRHTLILALGVMGSMAVVFVLFGRHIVVVFGATPEVLNLAGTVIRISALEQLPIAVLMVIAGSMRGAGDTRTPMYVTFAGVLLFRVALVYLFAIVFGWGLVGVWLGTAVDFAGRATFISILFRRGRWKQVRV